MLHIYTALSALSCLKLHNFFCICSLFFLRDRARKAYFLGSEVSLSGTKLKGSTDLRHSHLVYVEKAEYEDLL